MRHHVVEFTPEPTLAAESGVLGLCSPSFVPATPTGDSLKNYSCVANPLRQLPHNDIVFEWMTECCQPASKELKDRLTHAPILSHYDPTKPAGLETDKGRRCWSKRAWEIKSTKQREKMTALHAIEVLARVDDKSKISFTYQRARSDSAEKAIVTFSAQLMLILLRIEECLETEICPKNICGPSVPSGQSWHAGGTEPKEPEHLTVDFKDAAGQ
ncbi:hypothetical protein PAAG_11600 [Paracoccidioides lutzii Pb01]|uniref:Uncharacterized protein n=1 Tax=Paracoccidioides lutzii (strain ATCC MYA-826 / Pb01) TaxID=502779 RepID=A0A0A2V2A4_PARBA|nr:hypothetical protein PAAG_11600 [Paracoccidioides lutzii Pb01]KGQ01618.1 hypothetical protein PAAG_11600 [Paracoccidioides lutzii Pb01]